MSSTNRTFIAIPLPGEISRNLIDFATRFHLNKPSGFRPVSLVNIHLSLKFLGETTALQQQQIVDCLNIITQEVSTFDFTIQGVGIFPNLNRPRVVWAGASAPSQILTLHKEVDHATSLLGFRSENARFSPHVTIARVAERSNREMIQVAIQVLSKIDPPIFGTIRVQSITLFRSVLQPGGPIYTPLSVHILKGAHLS